MKEEIGAAVNFLTRLVGKSNEINSDQVKVFENSLGVILTEKFKDHWFPEKPYKGQAYRCIRVNGNGRRDPVLKEAAEMCGVRYENLKLPVELTVWVDPQEVCCRFGEDEGSYCTVASFKDNKENLSDNVIEEVHLNSSSSYENSPECQKKQKNRRKSVDKQKKQSNSRSYPMPLFPPKGFNPKNNPNNKSVSCYMNNYFNWSPPEIPHYPSRFPRSVGAHFQDLTFIRRAKKPPRSVFLNDRYHWARK